MEMRLVGILIGILAAALALQPVSVFAQSSVVTEEKSSPLASHLPLRKEACFGRVYDARHLASHPKQRVTSLFLFRDFSVDTNAEYTPDDPQSLRDADGEYDRVNLSAYVRLRNRKGVYSNSFSCGRADGGGVSCSIDCDGGSFRLKPAGASLDLTNEGFVVVGGCGGSEEDNDNPVSVRPGADDRTFRLTPQPLNACIAERDAQKPAFAALGKPLRVRLSTAEPRCFARSYDAGHLAAHGSQQVRRIAVFKARDDARKDDDAPGFKLSFRVERRDGKTFEKAAECVPDNYVYACTSPSDADGAREFYLSRAGENDIMLRDPRRVLPALLGTSLGADDKSFKLTQGDDSACRF